MARRARLTTPGVVVAGGALTAVAAAGDLVLDRGLGAAFLVLFVAVCAWISAHATRPALFAAAILPPLAFLGAVLLAVATGRGVPPSASGWVQLVATMGTAAPAVFAATAVGSGLAFLRRARSDRAPAAFEQGVAAPEVDEAAPVAEAGAPAGDGPVRTSAGSAPPAGVPSARKHDDVAGRAWTAYDLPQ